MDRKKALTFAGTAGITVLAAGVAMAANAGLLTTAQSTGDDVGNLDARNIAELVSEDPSTTTVVTPGTEVEYVDEYVQVPGGGVSGSDSVAPGVAPQPTAPTVAPSPSSPGDDDHDDDGTTFDATDDDHDETESELEDHDEDEVEVEDEHDEIEDEHEELEEEHEYEGVEDDD